MWRSAAQAGRGGWGAGAADGGLVDLHLHSPTPLALLLTAGRGGERGAGRPAQRALCHQPAVALPAVSHARVLLPRGGAGRRRRGCVLGRCHRAAPS
eukprot:357958-Chlamydomonas_euryale.AAC.1